MLYSRIKFFYTLKQLHCQIKLDFTPDPERTDDANEEIELDIEIADEERDDDDDFLSDNESDDGNGNAEENGDPIKPTKMMMFMILNKNISVKHFQKG